MGVVGGHTNLKLVVAFLEPNGLLRAVNFYLGILYKFKIPPQDMLDHINIVSCHKGRVFATPTLFVCVCVCGRGGDVVVSKEPIYIYSIFGKI